MAIPLLKHLYATKLAYNNSTNVPDMNDETKLDNI